MGNVHLGFVVGEWIHVIGIYAVGGISKAVVCSIKVSNLSDSVIRVAVGLRTKVSSIKGVSSGISLAIMVSRSSGSRSKSAGLSRGSVSSLIGSSSGSRGSKLRLVLGVLFKERRSIIV